MQKKYKVFVFILICFLFVCFIDYEDPRIDWSRANEEGYLDNFRKPLPNAEKMPFSFIFPLDDHFPESNPKPVFNDYNGTDKSINDMSLWNNEFKKSDSAIYFDAGTEYIQLNFIVKSVKQYTGDNNSTLVNYTGGGIVYDIALMPYTF